MWPFFVPRLDKKKWPEGVADLSEIRYLSEPTNYTAARAGYKSPDINKGGTVERQRPSRGPVVLNVLSRRARPDQRLIVGEKPLRGEWRNT